MRYLLIAPQLGFEPLGKIIPGGLQQFGRCVARALASSPSIKKLGIWSQMESFEAERAIQEMIKVYAHSKLELEVKGFEGNRPKMGLAVLQASWRYSYDHVMYLLVNQAGLALLPGHPSFSVWEIGRELFQPISWWKYRALRQADRLLSISNHTTQAAVCNNPGLSPAQVVHLCLEPPLFEPEPDDDPVAHIEYCPTKRDNAVLIVGSMYKGLLYKGQQQLIAAWPKVITVCPTAELWIVGGGNGRYDLEQQAKALLPNITTKIKFLGQVDNTILQELYRRCRVFAMPSTQEGFGLVFIEAARYGIPSIGGRYDSVKEIVLDNISGLLVEQQPDDIANVCIRLLTDDHLAQRLGTAARQRYLDYFRFQHFRKKLLHTLELEY